MTFKKSALQKAVQMREAIRPFASVRQWNLFITTLIFALLAPFFVSAQDGNRPSVQQLLDPVAHLPSDQLSKQLVKYNSSQIAPDRAQHYRGSLESALAQLNDGTPQ